MNSERTDFNKIALIRKLQILRELEMKKPINEIDTDFIDEINLFGLELKGLKATLTPEEVEEKVRKIPFVEETATLNTTPESVKGRSTKVNTHKILLIAAIISILVAIFTISSIAFDWNIFDELKNKFGTVFDAPVNQKIDVDGITVVMNGNCVTYTNVEEFLEQEKLEILYPIKLPKNVVLKQIMVSKYNSKEKVVFIFDEPEFTYTIVFNEVVSENVKNGAQEILNLNKNECYVTKMKDINSIQIHFENNKNLYCLNYNNEQELKEVIENLKEFKNEN